MFKTIYTSEINFIYNELKKKLSDDDFISFNGNQKHDEQELNKILNFISSKDLIEDFNEYLRTNDKINVLKYVIVV